MFLRAKCNGCGEIEHIDNRDYLCVSCYVRDNPIPNGLYRCTVKHCNQCYRLDKHIHQISGACWGHLDLKQFVYLYREGLLIHENNGDDTSTVQKQAVEK